MFFLVFRQKKLKSTKKVQKGQNTQQKVNGVRWDREEKLWQKDCIQLYKDKQTDRQTERHTERCRGIKTRQIEKAYQINKNDGCE